MERQAAQALLLRGQDAARSGDFAQAAELYRRAAPAEPDALVFLGYLHRHGCGGPVDGAKAVAYFREAADLGSALGVFNLGVSADVGEGGPRDEAAAVACYRRAHELGCADATCALGECYERGRGGLAPDPTQAFALHAAAAERGHPRGYQEVARCCTLGIGTPADPLRAAQALQAAAAALSSADRKARLPDEPDAAAALSDTAPLLPPPLQQQAPPPAYYGAVASPAPPMACGAAAPYPYGPVPPMQAPYYGYAPTPGMVPYGAPGMVPPGMVYVDPNYVRMQQQRLEDERRERRMAVAFLAALWCCCQGD